MMTESDPMIPRRDLVRTSLTICGCSVCGSLGVGAFGGAARADSATSIRGSGYELWFVGAQRETIMNGRLAAALDLRTLASRPHLYGVGPIEQLRGEVTIADSRPALARVTPEGTVSVSESFDARTPFFVWAEVPRWVERTIPPEIRSYEDLGRFVPLAATAAGLDADQPLPFLVTLNRIGDAPHNMEMHKQIQIRFELEQAEAMIVGFHSTRHRGVFTPGDSNIHVHFQTPDNAKSGHIQKLRLGDGASLKLPVA